MSNDKISVHDNQIVSYEVFCEAREVVFKTKSPSEPPENINVCFTGVAAYSFCDDGEWGTVIFDIGEGPPMELYDRLEKKFVEGVPYGWPGKWAKTRETAEQFFRETGTRAWHLSSSLGMCGWVLARAMDIIVVEDMLPRKYQDS